MAHNVHRKGSDAEKRAKALAEKGKTVKDGRERNLGAGGEEHSRIAKGNRTQRSDPTKGRRR